MSQARDVKDQRGGRALTADEVRLLALRRRMTVVFRVLGVAFIVLAIVVAALPVIGWARVFDFLVAVPGLFFLAAAEVSRKRANALEAGRDGRTGKANGS